METDPSYDDDPGPEPSDESAHTEPEGPGQDLAAVPDPDESDQVAAEREQADQAELEDAMNQLSLPVGGIRPSTAKIQVTGGAVTVPPAHMPEKDAELEIVVKGWVKTISNSTDKKGVTASRTAIFVVEDVLETHPAE